MLPEQELPENADQFRFKGSVKHVENLENAKEKGETYSPLAAEILQADSFETLYDILRQAQAIRSGTKSYAAEELISRIETLRAAPSGEEQDKAFFDIIGAAGLRARVSELWVREKKSR